MPVQKFLSTSNAITIECENTRRWATKAPNKLRISITQNLQVECADKPDHPNPRVLMAGRELTQTNVPEPLHTRSDVRMISNSLIIKLPLN